MGKRSAEKKAAKGEKSSKKGKKAKDANRPKRAQNSYQIFLADNRAVWMKEFNNKIGLVGKKAGTEWKASTAAKKAPYEKKAADLKKVADKAIAEYKAANPAAGADEEDD